MNNRQKVRTDILYYLSHPYTSYGDADLNRDNAILIECNLCNENNLSVINPVGLPLGFDNEFAMKKCRSLYDACDAVIFCDNWNKSQGCMTEHKWTVEDGKPKYRYRNGELIVMNDYQEYLDSVLDPRD